MFFWRDKAGHEIDVILEQGNKLLPVEIKSGQTISSDFARELKWWQRLAKKESGPSRIVYGGMSSLEQYVSWWELPWYAG